MSCARAAFPVSSERPRHGSLTSAPLPSILLHLGPAITSHVSHRKRTASAAVRCRRRRLEGRRLSGLKTTDRVPASGVAEGGEQRGRGAEKTSGERGLARATTQRMRNLCARARSSCGRRAAMDRRPGIAARVRAVFKFCRALSSVSTAAQSLHRLAAELVSTAGLCGQLLQSRTEFPIVALAMWTHVPNVVPAPQQHQLAAAVSLGCRHRRAQDGRLFGPGATERRPTSRAWRRRDGGGFLRLRCLESEVARQKRRGWAAR